jgi:hypothetical protein
MTLSIRPGARAVLLMTVSAAFFAAACSSDGSKNSGDGSGNPGTGGSAAGTTADTDPEPTADDFQCITKGTLVQGFYAKNRYSDDVSGAVTAANSTDGGDYPPGTLIQLIPIEAMVKRYPGYSPDTKDWEFFSLNVTASGTEIATKGTTDVLNAFNLNCLDCHKKADEKFDMVCEKTHGCDPLPFTDDQITSIQNGDPRCTQ